MKFLSAYRLWTQDSWKRWFLAVRSLCGVKMFQRSLHAHFPQTTPYFPETPGYLYVFCTYIYIVKNILRYQSYIKYSHCIHMMICECHKKKQCVWKPSKACLHTCLHFGVGTQDPWFTMIACMLENDNPRTQKIRGKHCKHGIELQMWASTTPWHLSLELS